MSLDLNNGYKMPKMGFGTWQVKGDGAEEAISVAFDLGYRHFDGAWIYGNEELVGEILKKKLSETKVERKELFITSKLWNCFHRPDQVEKGLDESLERLKMDYVDLYLIHWPVSYKPGKLFLQPEEVAEGFDDVDIVETWKAMETLVEKGKAKSIGLSNFNKEQIQYILDNCKIKPAVLQIEAHIYLPNEDMRAFCESKAIQVTAYSPLGSPGRPWAEAGDTGPLDDPLVETLAAKVGCTKGQLLIAFILNRGMICIPKSVKPKRIEENYKALDVKLSSEDMKTLTNIETRRRLCVPNVIKTHKFYPFKDEL